MMVQGARLFCGMIEDFPSNSFGASGTQPLDFYRPMPARQQVESIRE
jgi:hypothetical protein